MIITEARQGDEKQIVELLKQSLGESLMPKNETYWKWKHTDNYFGASKVLLAKDGEQLIGLRAFMRWQWQKEHEMISTVRAVDTATHPLHQGKGIFRKLTMQAVEECKNEGIALVFNTPNPKSMAGYLTMGWKKAGKMPLCFSSGSLRPRFYDESFETGIYETFNTSSLNALPGNWSTGKAHSGFETIINKEYLNWRYHQCPVVKYGVFGDLQENGFVFRLKKVSRFMELRICEAWVNNDRSHSSAISMFRAVVKKIRPAVITMAPTARIDHSLRKRLGFWLSLHAGPVTTIRPLALQNTGDFEKFKNWSPSIGSMELF